MFRVDFNQCPLIVIWECTRACQLACKHCRAEAIDYRDPRELSNEEGKKLIDDIVEMGTPLFVFTGGDPLQREDLEDLIVYAKGRGLRVGAIPAATDRLTRERVFSLKETGLDQMALSLDSVTAEKHDDFRQVPGCYDKVMQGAAWAREAGIPLQFNTVLAAWNFDEFDDLAKMVTDLGTVFWEVFFLIPTGRGKTMDSCTAEQFEILFEKLYKLSKEADFIVKVTEAQHYRRYIMQQEMGDASDFMTSSHLPGGATARGTGQIAVNSGKGFAFIDHIGEVYPSGFLPLSGGNVRRKSIIDIYRDSELFTDLRNPELLKGKCGACEFKVQCSGSRSRAFAVHQDIQAEEPFCAYIPQELRAKS